MVHIYNPSNLEAEARDLTEVQRKVEIQNETVSQNQSKWTILHHVDLVYFSRASQRLWTAHCHTVPLLWCSKILHQIFVNRIISLFSLPSWRVWMRLSHIVGYYVIRFCWVSCLFASLELRRVWWLWVASESLPGVDTGSWWSQIELFLGIGSWQKGLRMG